MRPSKASFATVLVAALTLCAGAARADEPAFEDVEELSTTEPAPPPPPPKPDPYRMYTYDPAHGKHHFRAAMEVFGILVLGNVDYLQNTTARGGKLRTGDAPWSFRYDWAVLRSKLAGENFRVDTNRFNTNYISHPFAGTLYYTTARANHLGVGESFGYAFAASLLWEYFGELREEVSVNDAIVTPVSGFAIGEAFHQLGGFFSRGRSNFRDGALAALFTPARVLNDWADGADPRRSTQLDAHGLPTDIWHRFEVFAGAALTTQRHDEALAGHYFDARAGVDMKLANLPGYAGATRREAFFDDGNLAHLRFEATWSEGRLADALLSARVVPAGYYWRDATVDAAGEVRGGGAVLGLLALYEYGVHDFDRDRARPLDVTTILSPIGLTFQQSHARGETILGSGIDVAPTFAGVTAYALTAYRRQHARDDANLQTVLREQGYYHALGASVAPWIELSRGPLSVGAKLRYDGFRGIEGADVNQGAIVREVSLFDRRITLRAWSAATLGSVRLELGFRRSTREGSVGDARASQDERSWMGTISYLF